MNLKQSFLKLCENKEDYPVLEFAYQGPLLKYFGDKITIAITGDVNFTIKKNDSYSWIYKHSSFK